MDPSYSFCRASCELQVKLFLWIARHSKFYLDDSFYPGVLGHDHMSHVKTWVYVSHFSRMVMKKQPSHKIVQGKSLEIYEHLQFYLRFKPSEVMGKAMVFRWFPFFSLQKPGRAGQRCLGDGDDFRALYDVVLNVSI